jgi:hypothetical protein
MHRELVGVFVAIVHRDEPHIRHLIEQGHASPVSRLFRGAA